jgi:hypothetical protein
MHIKNRSHINTENYIKNAQDDISDALYLSIKSNNLPYSTATLDRITPVRYAIGKVLLDHYLDYGTPEQKLLVRTEFISASDDEVGVDRLHTQYFKGKSNIPSFIATA